MRDELKDHYDEFKNFFDILPVNNKENRQKKSDYLLEEEKTNNENIKLVLDEIKLRLSAFHGLFESEDIKKLSDKLESCNISNEWNQFNTSYEKMHLDFYLYQLGKYSSEDLNTVNECFKKILASFEKVGIKLTKEDFNYSKYVTEYMDLIINKADDTTLKNKFEEIYWKFPELIKTIEINFKSIYLKYEKKIDKFYSERYEEFKKKYNEQDIYDMKIKLTQQLRQAKQRDGYLIFNKFLNNEYMLSTFSKENIDKLKETYFKGESYNYDNLMKLAYALFEYSLIIKYNFLLENMRERLEKKDEFKSSKSNALKEINKAEGNLLKLNKQNTSKWPFGKKNDEKWLFKYNEVLTDLTTKFDSLDNECFNDLIYSKLSQDSSILDVLKLIASHYLYFVAESKKIDENKSISDITQNYNELKEDINNKQFSILNSIALLDKKEMKQVIADKFQLDGINLLPESLEEDNLEKTMEDINDLINYEDICQSEVDIDDIELYLEFEKMK